MILYLSQCIYFSMDDYMILTFYNNGSMLKSKQIKMAKQKKMF